MTAAATARPAVANHRQAVMLLAGFAAAVGARVAIGGLGVAQSVTAGLVFAACLVAMAATKGVRTTAGPASLGLGALGGTVLCLPAAAARLTGAAPHRPGGSFVAWAVEVAVVAAAEELFLRGALFDAVEAVGGRWSAVVVSAAAFAALHVPLYGWSVIPADFAVGMWLGGLRSASGTWAAPGVAHVVADLAGWWLR